MSVIYKEGYNLSLEEITYLTTKIQFQVANATDCIIWPGYLDKYGYPAVHVTLRGKKMRLGVPRLIYFLSKDCKPLTLAHHISHLCHNKICLNIEHLSFEPGHVNIRRNTCKSNNKCFGHDNYADCII